ncbi:MAG: DNA helicase [Wendovervirus sonii]|uniref:DNA helicase n=1 Tax=phage Lak_Megaphage_Sonny TaxID=3109229 RepID=A0ABZ0Z507_9CAUD|nr:MAG: DNA helicase [phage Lak_Megaphage_Sonny]
MENTSSRMQWFINKYKSGKLTYDIANTKMAFGTVVMPTGTGKSGVIYEDCIYNIQHMRSNKKLIICICSHILNLNEQTFTAFFDVLLNCKGVLDNHKVKLFLNSSAETKQYKDMTYHTRTNIDSNIENIENFENSEYDIALVSSCNKSLHKFINRKINAKNIDIISYIDECHTIINNKTTCNYDINLEKLAKKSYKLYGLSATPSYFVQQLNCIIKKYKLNGTSKYLAEEEPIINISPAEAINNNIIVKPYIKFLHNKNGELNSQTIIKCMLDAIESKNVTNHKMLVTCYSRSEATKLYNECQAAGYKCYKNTSDDDWKIKQFCTEIENYKGNCIIFHCRKLIQGIDIQSITEAIITNNNNGNVDNNIRLIQIIGRAIRTASNEREMNIKLRDKKFANIYIVSNGNEEYDTNISNIIVKYYGINNIIYNNFIGNYGKSPIPPTWGGSTKDKKTKISEIKNQIDELKINFKQYLELKVIPVYKDIIYNGGIIDLETVINSCDLSGLTDTNTLDLFNNVDKINIIKNTFKQYNIDL